MTITKDLLLYFIRDRKLDEQSEITQKQEFSGIQHWIADVRKLKREYLLSHIIWVKRYSFYLLRAWQGC